MKPRSFRLIVIAGIAAVSLGSSLLISSGNASGDHRVAGRNAEQSVAPQFANPTDRIVASAARRAD
jgi:hypothetical protein